MARRLRPIQTNRPACTACQATMQAVGGGLRCPWRNAAGAGDCHWPKHALVRYTAVVAEPMTPTASWR